MAPPSHHQQLPLPLGDGVIRAANFTAAPPSPPAINVPSAHIHPNHPSLTLTPSFESVDTGSLTAEDIDIITGGRLQHAGNPSDTNWRYEDRRKAQAILDFLYLGPSTVVRDRDFLRQQGITMLLAARDGFMARMQMLSVDKVAAELGIEAAYVDVPTRPDLVRAFPAAVTKINEHLLRVYKAQAQGGQAPDGQMIIDKDIFRRGKVLLFCETGNERSAAVAAAYLMAMYGRDMISAVQFVSAQRFCVNINDEMKYQLRSFGDILVAQRMTAQAAAGQNRLTNANPNNGAADVLPPPANDGSAARKRGIEDTMDEDEDSEFAMDVDRYENRPAFVPYFQGDIKMLPG